MPMSDALATVSAYFTMLAAELFLRVQQEFRGCSVELKTEPDRYEILFQSDQADGPMVLVIAIVTPTTRLTGLTCTLVPNCSDPIVVTGDFAYLVGQPHYPSEQWTATGDGKRALQARYGSDWLRLANPPEQFSRQEAGVPTLEEHFIARLREVLTENGFIS